LKRIASLYSKIPDNATNIEIIFRGFVSPTVVTNYDRKLAAARVAAVKKQLLKRGIVAQITIPTLAVDKKSTPTKARRVDIVVVYDLPVSNN
jgi:outer membrane protein OmpA-like peptidoglycan-associated protein